MAVSSIGRAFSFSMSAHTSSIEELEGSKFESWTALAPTDKAGTVSGLPFVFSLPRGTQNLSLREKLLVDNLGLPFSQAYTIDLVNSVDKIQLTTWGATHER